MYVYSHQTNHTKIHNSHSGKLECLLIKNYKIHHVHKQSCPICIRLCHIIYSVYTLKIILKCMRITQKSNIMEIP